jgi:hypothetical protein
MTAMVTEEIETCDLHSYEEERETETRGKGKRERT